MRRYKVHVSNEQFEDQSSPEVEETFQALYAASLQPGEDGGREGYQYEDVASSSQDSLCIHHRPAYKEG